jgi:hypothetical protein
MSLPDISQLTEDDKVSLAIGCLIKLPLARRIEAVQESFSEEEIDDLVVQLTEDDDC